MKQYLYVALFFITALFNNYSIAQTNNYSIDDVFSFKRIGFVSPSPDGKQIAYTTLKVETGPLGKHWVYHLNVKDARGNVTLVAEGSDITAVKWSHNGKYIAYLQKKNNLQELWVYQLATHTGFPLVQRDIYSFKWSPSNSQIAFVATEEKATNELKAPAPIEVASNASNLRLYTIAVKKEAQPVVLTPNTISIAVEYLDPGFDYAPNGKSIAFAYQPHSGSPYFNDSKIAILNIATHEISYLPYMKSHTGNQPTYSPNGKYIAFRTTDNESDNKALTTDIHLVNRICTYDVNSLNIACLANTFNSNPAILGWNKASNAIYVVDAFKTAGLRIYKLNIDTSPATLLSDIDGFIDPLTLSINDTGTHVGFGYETLNTAPEVYSCSLEPFNLKQVTHLQTDTSQILGKAETIKWKSSDGMEIEGLLLTPNDYDAKKRYPLYVDIHGGPDGARWKRYLGGCDEYGDMLDPSTCWGHLLSQGFVIFQPNYRGSTGYGKYFRLANYADFGGGDFHDILSGVDYLIKKGIADEKHLAIGGWSYGGYLTAWTISQTDRFKAAIMGSGISNLVSFSGTTDIPLFTQNFLGNPFWEKDKLYLQRSPLFSAKKITTPLLIVTGEKDTRVPSSQSYELHSSLSLQHKPVKMLVLPEQSHVPQDPNLIEASIKAIDDWLKNAS